MPEWTEPQTAGPQNSVTGYNFGTPPPKKSGRGRKKTVKRMSRASSVASGSESSPAPESTNGVNGHEANGNTTDSTRPSSPSSSPQVEDRVSHYETTNKRSLKVALDKTEPSTERGSLKRQKTTTPVSGSSTPRKRGRPKGSTKKGNSNSNSNSNKSGTTPTPSTPKLGSTPNLGHGPGLHIKIKVAR